MSAAKEASTDRLSVPARAERTPLVHVRTPTYRRPEALRRCLESIRAQVWRNWVCDVFDDDMQGSARSVVAELDDSRIRYTRNPGQKFASRNIDQCFSRQNPHDADYFCIIEDDNAMLPEYMAQGIEDCRRHKVEIVLRNQFVELESASERARLLDCGVLDERYREGVMSPQTLRMALLVFHGVSNSGLFWSRRARSDLEVGYACNVTFAEHLRTFSIREPIFIGLEPKAVWADNGAGSTRNNGLKKSEIRRELDLKRNIVELQGVVWHDATVAQRAGFLSNSAFHFSAEARAEGLAKAHLAANAGGTLSSRRAAELYARGALIRLAGRLEAELPGFIRERRLLEPAPAQGYCASNAGPDCATSA
ncbi:glycosyltransferase family 2 protein [Alloyangia pacifica]|uniref:glycosyltransferase family 2 protein n=1 Tax=Alloyangia pacifica TaxID=311180 RepID=UPI001CFE1B47|nr:glycosyltransferase [Alloyangia pacifica]